MTEAEFLAWTESHGVSEDVGEQLTVVAATPEEMQEASAQMSPPPPIYSLDDIKGMTDSDEFVFRPLDHDLLLVGGCPNGDPIAVDIGSDMGAVLYIDHSVMHRVAPREAGVKVADSITELINGLAYNEDFPLDSTDAKRQVD